MGQENLEPRAFIDAYGVDAAVVVGSGMNMNLGQALAMEELFCPAGEADRQDPAKRLSYLAGMLAAADSLLPEHKHLLGSESE